MAKSLKNLIRLHEWQLDERRRELAVEQKELDQLEGVLRALLAEVAREQEIVHKTDDLTIIAAFGPFSQKAKLQRETLEATIVIKEKQVEEARENLAEAFKELKTYEISQANRDKKEALELARKDQETLDEIGLNAHRMKQMK
ncbi:MAG: flagellar export protein FliJ [Rhodospirillales bacterium]|nr:flagellar export protein FliJ [Rhodospirillales bacterium]